MGDAGVAVVEGRGEGRGRVAAVRRRKRRGGLVVLRGLVRALRVGACVPQPMRVRVRVQVAGADSRAPPEAPCPRARARGRRGAASASCACGWPRAGSSSSPRSNGVVLPSASWVWSFRWWVRCHTGPRIPPPTKATSWTSGRRSPGSHGPESSGSELPHGPHRHKSWLFRADLLDRPRARGALSASPFVMTTANPNPPRRPLERRRTTVAAGPAAAGHPARGVRGLRPEGNSRPDANPRGRPRGFCFLGLSRRSECNERAHRSSGNAW